LDTPSIRIVNPFAFFKAQISAEFSFSLPRKTAINPLHEHVRAGMFVFERFYFMLLYPAHPALANVVGLTFM
jgi:hypothetical protein